MRKFTLLFVLAASLLACGPSKVESLIAEYEQNVGGIKTDLDFKMKELKLVGEWSTSDSARVYISKIDSLKVIYYPKADIDTITNEKTLADIDSLIASFRRTYKEYNDMPSLRKQIEWQKKRDEFFLLMLQADKHNIADSVLYNIYECTYTIKNPFLNAVQTITNQYFLTLDESRIASKGSVDI